MQSHFTYLIMEGVKEEVVESASLIRKFTLENGEGNDVISTYFGL